MTKEFEEELEDLCIGLRQLNNMKPKTYRGIENIKHAKEIQKARIQFFGKGYGLRCRELDGQTKINDVPVIIETGRQTCL